MTMADDPARVARARRLARLTDQVARDDYPVDLDELAACIAESARRERRTTPPHDEPVTPPDDA
jgi:hypothetical protein